VPCPQIKLGRLPTCEADHAKRYQRPTGWCCVDPLRKESATVGRPNKPRKHPLRSLRCVIQNFEFGWHMIELTATKGAWHRQGTWMQPIIKGIHMICHGRLPCEAAWPRLMHTRSLWGCRHGSRRVSFLSVLCSAAPVAPSPEAATPSASRDPQDGLLSLRQLVRTYGARSGDQRWFSSTATAAPSSRSASPGAAASALLHAELLEAARLSKLAGLCYWPHDQLAERLQAEGLELVAQGSNYFTSWYVCDADDWSASPTAAAQPSAAAAAPDSGTHAASVSVAAGRAGSSASATEAGTGPGRRSGGVRRRLVLLRGVTWFAADVESMRVWGLLVRACIGRAAHDRPSPINRHSPWSILFCTCATD